MIVIIDSTHFKQDRGLNKEDLSLIKDLGRQKLISLHIPWFVYQETSSSSIFDLTTELNSIKNSLRSFNRKGMNKRDYVESRKLVERVNALINNVKNSNEDLWKTFVKDSKATLHKFNEKDSTKVFEAYFTGEKPFKSLKNRNDIPDAFIYATIKKVALNSTIHLISGDKNLTEKCNEDNNIVIHNTFEEFYIHDDFKKIEKNYNQLKFNQKIEGAKEIIIDNKDSIDEAVRDFCSNIQYLEFVDESLPSDNGDATIFAIDDPEIIIEEGEIKFIDNKFFVPITVKGKASIDYAVFKSDYWQMEEHLSISEDLNKHYYLIEETLPIVLKKTLTFELANIDENELLEVEIDEFDELYINRKEK